MADDFANCYGCNIVYPQCGDDASSCCLCGYGFCGCCSTLKKVPYVCDGYCISNLEEYENAKDERGDDIYNIKQDEEELSKKFKSSCDCQEIIKNARSSSSNKARGFVMICIYCCFPKNKLVNVDKDELIDFLINRCGFQSKEDAEITYLVDERKRGEK